jgi:hypothetical protein
MVVIPLVRHSSKSDDHANGVMVILQNLFLARSLRSLEVAVIPFGITAEEINDEIRIYFVMLDQVSLTGVD